jgi:aspartokinase/homoserine dehydrogenase 1
VGSAVSNRNWVVHKFGGTSVANAECFRRVSRLMHDQSEPRQAVVVSAMGGMTNALLELINGAERADGKVAAGIEAIRGRYTTTANELISDASVRAGLLDTFNRELGETGDILNAVTLVRSAAQRSRDVVAGYGEIWSTRLLAAYLQQERGTDPLNRAVSWIDARQVLIVEQGELGPAVLQGFAAQATAGHRALYRGYYRIHRHR